MLANRPRVWLKRVQLWQPNSYSCIQQHTKRSSIFGAALTARSMVWMNSFHSGYSPRAMESYRSCIEWGPFQHHAAKSTAKGLHSDLRQPQSTLYQARLQAQGSNSSRARPHARLRGMAVVAAAHLHRLVLQQELHSCKRGVHEWKHDVSVR